MSAIYFEDILGNRYIPYGNLHSIWYPTLIFQSACDKAFHSSTYPNKERNK